MWCSRWDGERGGGRVFVDAHPSRKNKDAARVGHPVLWMIALRSAGLEFFAGEFVPCGDGFRQGRADGAGCDGFDDLLGCEIAACVAEHGLDPADGGEAFAAS